MEVLPETFEVEMSLRKPEEVAKIPVPPRTRD
jgi:hypothetical protein